ncbi:MAG: hypothetical protein M1503_12350 [Thaumarchaeota archaeon]|nr:hypothetical protein [Nitrososphaerota archaeon]MCL5319031.1 hypothetical protein [Nitrososphaerota archaeon]
MDTKIYLCGKGHCPAVEMQGDKVLIGEDKNTAVLSKAEWNVLVEKIKTGELRKI